MQSAKVQGIAFQIIAEVESARTMYKEAIRVMKEDKDLKTANQILDEAKELAVISRTKHLDLLQKEVEGEAVVVNLMLTHATELLACNETFEFMCEEMLEMYYKIDNIEKKLGNWLPGFNKLYDLSIQNRLLKKQQKLKVT